MKTSLLCLLASLLVISCSKDKFTTVPQVKMKSISPGTVRQGDVIAIKAKFTDQEGDVDSVFVIYKWYNGSVGFQPLDTLKISLNGLGVPVKTKEADIVVEFAYGADLLPTYLTLPLSPVTRDTTATFGFVLKDKAGNRSEYTQSDAIRLLKR